MTTDVGTAVAAIVAGPVPDQVIAWARGALEDTLAVLVAGTTTPLYNSVVRTAQHHPGSRPALGVPSGTSAAWAAQLGAVAASALDFDDGHYRGGGIHAGSTVVPVLLAAAGDITVAELLRGIVVGYEVAIRAGYLNSPALTQESYRASGYAATVGASAALAAVRGGSAEVISAAVRTAFAHAPHSRMTSLASRESIGWAAATAVSSVHLAEAGFGDESQDRRHHAPAGPTPFEESTDTWVRSLGSEFSCLETYVKPWPCCRAAHAMIEALLRFAEDSPADEIEAVEVFVVPGAVALDVTRPANLSEAQYALPWLAAIALLRGEPGISRLSALDFQAEDVCDLASRVRLRPGTDSAPGCGYPAEVHLLLRDGSTVRHAVTDNIGSASRPLSPAALERKHTNALRSRLDQPAIDALRQAIDDPTRTVDHLWRLLIPS